MVADSTHRTTLVKLGGSLITDKGGLESARSAMIKNLAEQIGSFVKSGSGQRLIVGHGSGSFGHAAASGTALDPRGDESEADVSPERFVELIAGVQAAARRLHAQVCEALIAAGVPAVSMPPASFCLIENDEVGIPSLAPLRAALSLSAVPVVFGDVLFGSTTGGRIASTEEVLLALAARLGGADRAIWLGVTDGILDEKGEALGEIRSTADFDRALAVSGASAGTDVTGGMNLRLRSVWKLAQQGVASRLVDGRSDRILVRCLQDRERSGTYVPGHTS